MNSHYNQDYNIKDIESVLNIIKDCIRNNSYTIALNENRIENINFINEYNINSKKQREILLNVKTSDFCHSLKNKKVGYENEILYVFAPQVTLYNIDIEEIVNVYLKFNIICRKNCKNLVVISFHKLNRKIDYLFR